MRRGGRGISLGMSEDRHIEIETGEGYTLSLGLLTNTQNRAFQPSWKASKGGAKANFKEKPHSYTPSPPVPCPTGTLPCTKGTQVLQRRL